MNILLLVFGNDIQYHTLANFCMLSVLQQCSENDIISVYTDRLDFYSRFKEQIEIVELDGGTLGKWLNGTDYIFRAKIMAIEDAARRFPNMHLLFLDCDTICVNSLENMRSLLDDGIGLLCNDEGHPSKMKGASKRMWDALANCTIGSCTISQKHNVWNSGVIGIPQSKLTEVIALAIDVCDYILQTKVRCFTAEQYAFSVAMQEYCKVVASTTWICHYWGNKEGWLHSIQQFFLESYMQGITLGQEMQKNAANKFYYELPIYMKRSNTKRRIEKVLDRIFLDKLTFNHY